MMQNGGSIKYLYILLFVGSLSAGIFALLFDGWIGGDGYRYMDTSTLSKSIVKEDTTVSLGSRKVVPRIVVYYDYNADFIIATRIVLDTYQCNYQNKKDMFNTTKLSQDLEYWIIDKKLNNVYRSTNPKKIVQKLQALHVDLEFDFSEDYKDIIEWLKSLESHEDLTNCKKIESPYFF